MSPQTFRLAAVLGLLSCVGPFAIDMILPAMPTLAAEFGATVGSAQITLTAFFLAFGVSQLVWGPWSDAVGRKLPLYVGLTIFAVGSLACAFAPSMNWLIAARFLQGIGAAVVMVLPRAIIRDTTTGNDATRLMATVMLVISVSPMLAPLFGSAVIGRTWKTTHSTVQDRQESHRKAASHLQNLHLHLTQPRNLSLLSQRKLKRHRLCALFLLKKLPYLRFAKAPK